MAANWKKKKVGSSNFEIWQKAEAESVFGNSAALNQAHVSIFNNKINQKKKKRAL
jgi:hypothetical protein